MSYVENRKALQRQKIEMLNLTLSVMEDELRRLEKNPDDEKDPSLIEG